MHQVTPKIHIIAETSLSPGMDDFLEDLGVGNWATKAHSDAEYLMEVAGKTCYLSFSTELNKNLTKVGTRSNLEYLQQGIIGTKHGSVLEHATVTIAFLDVSRVFTHELVRHRAGCAYSQVSGRYVRTDDLSFWLPSAIRESNQGSRIFRDAFTRVEDWIRELEDHFEMKDMKDFSLKKKLTSAFRRIIGNGQANHIIGTFNHRALRNIIQLRTHRSAEEEMRLVFELVAREVSDRFPAIYADLEIEYVDGYDEVTFRAEKV